MDKDFESIRSKVMKLQALAERGEKGEAINARRLLDQLLAKYGVSLEEIVEAQEEKQPYTFNVKDMKRMQKEFTEAYIQKHRIFGKHGDDNSEEERELSPEDLQRLLRMLNYMDSMEDTSYYKQIGNASSSD